MALFLYNLLPLIQNIGLFAMKAKKQVNWFMIGLLLVLSAACSASPVNTADPTPVPTTPNLETAETVSPTPTFPPIEPTFAARIAELRSPDVPVLPFSDNPDPTLCGIPTQWNSSEPAWLTGYYEGELIEPVVHLYDSHMRLNAVTKAPHGAAVKVLLYQSNPYLDYYLVKIEGAELPNEGWVPGPFLSFEKLSTEAES
jgi:hypothetical protein